MSGGRFDYKQYDIHRITNSIESIIAGEEDKEFGCEAIEVSKEVKEKLEEALIILKAAFIYLHRIDWLLSGDDDEKAFFKRIELNFNYHGISLLTKKENGKTIIQLSKNTMTNLDPQELAREIHINAKRKGFYDDADEEHFEEHQLYEIAKEIGEMHEAFKKNRFAAELNEKETIKSFEADIKDTFEDEMADIVIRCLDYMQWQGLNIHDPAHHEVSKNDRLLEKYAISSLCYEATEDIIEGRVYEVYSTIFSLAFAMEIDLDKHILAKMEYNKQRERLHGKRF